MKIHQNTPLEDIKEFYRHAIQYLLLNSMDDVGRFEAEHVKAKMLEMWVNDFFQKNIHLEPHIIEAVKHMFDHLSQDMDTSDYNKDKCSAGLW